MKDPNSSRKKLPLLITVVSAVVIIVSVYAYVNSTNLSHRSAPPLPRHYLIWASDVTEEYAVKHGYWNLTEPDKYVLRAINLTSQRIPVYVEMNATHLTLIKKLEENNWNPVVKYQDKYYQLGVYGSHGLGTLTKP